MNDVVYAPTPVELVEPMLDLADVRSGEVLADLGCGDGRIVIAAAKRGVLAFGYDCAQERIAEAQRNAGAQSGAATFILCDFFDLDLSNIDVVTLYLSAGPNAKLLPQLRRMRPESRIVSLDFSLGPPFDDCKEFMLRRRRVLYLWRNPLRSI